MGNQASTGRSGRETASSASAGSGGGSISNSNSNSSTTPASASTVDGGFISPMSGTYGNQVQEWDRAVVLRLIASRSLSPFYRGMQDEWEDGDADRLKLDRLLATAGKVPAQPPQPTPPGAEPEQIPLILIERGRESAGHQEAEAQAYERGTVECPICFLSYPANINYSRCCDQPMCTECFVQIKRVDPTPQNLTSEAVACPYCVEPEFGVVYRPPAVVHRRDADGTQTRMDGPGSPPAISDIAELSVSPDTGRRKSISASSASVVTVDHIHPDWQVKLDVARATAARRANRRIVFRRVGDRLIPVGITSSRDVLAAAAAAEANVGSTPPGSGGSEAAPSRRARRSRSGRDQDVNSYLSGLNGQDLEELMVMEAMRLSLLEQEEREKKAKADQGKADRDRSSSPGTAPLSHSISQATTASFATTSSSSSVPIGLAPPLLPLPSASTSAAPATTPQRRMAGGGGPGPSLLTQTAPASAALSAPSPTDQTGKITRKISVASSEASTIDLDAASYQRLDDDDE